MLPTTKKWLLLGVTALICLLPAVAHAQFDGIPDPPEGIAQGSDLRGAVTVVVNVFLALVGVAAGIFIIIGGLRYITSAGDEDQAEKGKKAVLYGVIGLIIVGLSAVIVNFTVLAIPG